MLNDPYYILPDINGFKGTQLDKYLAMGFYRMYHMIFTTTQTEADMEHGLQPVFWLRLLLPKKKESKAALAIRKKCASFTVTYKVATISPEVETLYSIYHSEVNFFTSNTCSGCMQDTRIQNPFDSLMIEIRDADILIAVGYFDKGNNSIMGILNFYHPQYKKYSLGKYLMLKKMDYACLNDMDYYYTGYISTATSKFDYKLFPDVAAIEVYLPIERKWIPYLSMPKKRLNEYYFAHFTQ